jgi:DNA-binding NtrC family response regulator
LENIAEGEADCLIIGETGTGKEVCARLIHALGPRKKCSFIAHTLLDFPDDLLGAQLKGHERGAFTGAINQMKGIFEQAHNGMLFLDEVGEYPRYLQAVLLRLLSSRELTRLSGSRVIEIDYKLITATNKSYSELGRHCTQAFFRRIDKAKFKTRPLRDTWVDIPALLQFILRRYPKWPNVWIPPNILKEYCLYPWPGNVGELENFVEDNIIEVKKDGKFAFPPPKSQNASFSYNNQIYFKRPWTLEQMDIVFEALRECNWVRNRAAKKLGIDPRRMRHGLHDLEEAGYDIPPSPLGKKQEIYEQELP